MPKAQENEQKTTKLIGLTGNIGSGKSTVAKLLVKKGAALIDSDALARAATYDPKVLAAIQAQLGHDLVHEGVLDRQKTAELVFNQPDALKTLNGIIHPWVREQSQARVSAFLNQAKPPAVILFDIPLLYENGLEKTVDAVIVVTAPLSLRIERVKQRSQLAEKDIRARDAAQLDLAQKAKRATYLIDNSSGLKSLEKQVDELWLKLMSPA